MTYPFLTRIEGLLRQRWFWFLSYWSIALYCMLYFTLGISGNLKHGEVAMRALAIVSIWAACLLLVGISPIHKKMRNGIFLICTPFLLFGILLATEGTGSPEEILTGSFFLTYGSLVIAPLFLIISLASFSTWSTAAEFALLALIFFILILPLLMTAVAPRLTRAALWILSCITFIVPSIYLFTIVL